SAAMRYERERRREKPSGASRRLRGDAAQVDNRGGLGGFAAVRSGFIREFLEVAGNTGNDGLVSFKRGVDAPFGGIQARGELCVCFVQGRGSESDHLWTECFQIGERQAGLFDGVAIGRGALQI